MTATEFEEASSVTFTSEDVRYVRSADGTVAYAILLDWPTDGELALSTSLHHRLTGRHRADDVVSPTAVELLGADIELDWTVDTEANVLRVSLPTTSPEALEHAYVLRLLPPSSV